MSRLSKNIIVLALVLTLGLHWMFLQSLAWVTMIAHYSQDYPLRQAIRMTFDGDHPCSICIFVSQGRQDEQAQRQERHLTIEKLVVFAVAPLHFVFAPPAMDTPRWSDPAFCSRTDEPPSPPPRSA